MIEKKGKLPTLPGKKLPCKVIISAKQSTKKAILSAKTRCSVKKESMCNNVP